MWIFVVLGTWLLTQKLIENTLHKSLASYLRIDMIVERVYLTNICLKRNAEKWTQHWHTFPAITCAVSIPLYFSGCNTPELRVASAVFNNGVGHLQASNTICISKCMRCLQSFKWVLNTHQEGIRNTSFTSSGILVAWEKSKDKFNPCALLRVPSTSTTSLPIHSETAYHT